MAVETSNDPVARITETLDYCIRRGLFFALLAIWATMFGLGFSALLAVKTGAILVTLVAISLLLRANIADRTPLRRTEVFMMLDGELGIPESRAPELIGRLRRERLLWHAQFVAVLALGMWGMTLVLRLVA